jgi:GTPase
MASESEGHRAGYIGILGRPNTGKSTLLNKVLGQKVSIISHKAQTTRNRVVGIHTTDDVQAVLVDTPGHHEAWSKLNKALVREAEAAIMDVDVVMLLVDLLPAIAMVKQEKDILSKGERVLLQRIQEEGKPIVLGLNKVDVVEPEWVLPVIDAWRALHDFVAIVPFSALKGRNVDALMDEACKLLPEGPVLFPEDQLMDTSERFVVSEIVREKLFHNLDQELPYSTAVRIERWLDEGEGTNSRVLINAVIMVERKSQKGIVIGKGGSMLKRIGTQARHDIQRLLNCRVRLELHVKVERDWTNNPRILRELGLEGKT